MFAENDKISPRQIKRLMIFCIFGISSLILPEILSSVSGMDGSAAILTGMFLTFGFLGLLGLCLKQMRGDYYAYLREAFGVKLTDICLIFYFFYYVCISGFAAYTICHLVLKNLLKEESFLVVLTVLVLAGAYGIYGGIECRVRVYEILFWTLMVLLFIMSALSVGSVDVDKWSPVFYDSGMDFLKSSYLVFGIFSWVFFLLFLKPFCAKEESLKKTMGEVLTVTGVMLFFIYLLLIGVFGTASLSETPFSVIVLMSMVELPGGFLERFDAVMVGIWFFALYALMDHTIFHSVDIFMRTFSLKKKKYPAILVLILVFAVAKSCWESVFFVQLLCRLFYWVAVPLSVLIPLLAYGIIRCKRREVHE